MPVLSIRGTLTKDGVAQIAPLMLEKGLSDETVATLKQMMSPGVLAMLQFSGGDLRKVLLDRLTPQVTAALQKGVEDVQVYEQTRSIVSSVQNLYDVGSPVPATLILLFSVIVPLTKAALVAWAVFMTSAAWRRRTVRFRRGDRQVVDGRRLRGGALHRLSRRAGDAVVRRPECGAARW